MATASSMFGKPSSDTEAMERATCELAESLQRSFADRDKLYQDIDATLFSEFPIDIPEAYRKTALEVRAPLAMHIATTVTAALSVNPPSVGFKPVGFGDVYQANSTLREKFFEASWHRQEQESRRSLSRLFMWSLAVKGEAVMKTMERACSAWSTYDQQASDYAKELDSEQYDQHARDMMYDHKTENIKLGLPYPIASTDVPPETFYYTQNENGITSAVEIKELPYLEALERFGAGLDSSGNVVDPETWSGYDERAVGLARAEWAHLMRQSDSQTLRCIEAWDHEVQVIVLQGPAQRVRNLSSSRAATLCSVRKHAYGDPYLKVLRGPYFHALGITTASRLPEHAGLSILFGYLELFRLLDSLLTIQANAAYLTGFPTFKSTVPPGSVPGLAAPPYGADQRENTPGRIEPGKLYPFDIAPVDQPKSGIESEKLLANIQKLTEMALPSVVQGLVASDQSGYALNQAAYLARLSWDPIVANAEVALGDRVGFESWLIQNRIGEKVYAWGEETKAPGKRGAGQSKGAWLGIGPDDLNGVHRYTVQLTPKTPSNEIIETRGIGEKMQLKLISYEDAVEKAGSNPDEVEKSWLLHDLKQSPEIQQQLKDAVFQKVATLRAARLDQMQQGLGPQPVPGGPGNTLPPGGPPNQVAGPPTAMPGTPGTPPSGLMGGMPPNPVPSPGAGLPLAPPPPPGVTGVMPPGGLPGMPGGVPGPPNAALRLPGQ